MVAHICADLRVIRDHSRLIMNIHVVGLNHKTAPIEIREKFYLNPLEQDLFLSELKSNPSVLSAFIISTCNRTEVYFSILDNVAPFPFIFKTLTDVKKLPNPAELISYFYTYKNQVAVDHLLRVVTGLDSLVLGEKQILGQAKSAIENAHKKGMLSRDFNVLTNLVIRAGKKAQSETQISFGGSSVSWAAIVKAEEVLGTLEGKSILIIGAGKMSELAVGQIQNRGFKKLYLMNRTGTNAENLAQKYGGEVVSFYEMRDVLSEVDICICSAGAPHYILEKAPVEKIMALRNNRTLIFIDISMPRNIDPKVSEVSGVHLYEIDDLNKVVDSNMKVRESAVPEVEQIVANKLSEFYQKLSKLPAEGEKDLSNASIVENLS